MAGAFPSLSHPILPATTRPKITVSASGPSRLSRRRNYLRPKILKTLNPKPDQQPAAPILPIESPVTPSQDNHELEGISEQSDVVLEGVAEVEEARVAETTAELSGISGNFTPRNVLKYGGYFVGLFVLQTVVSVLLLGNSDPDENRKSNLNSSSVSELGDVVRFDESQLGEKIEEIRAMARKARRIEKNEAKGSVGNGDDGVSKSKNKIGIEKEVGNRLVSLQKKLGSKREKLPGSFGSYLEMAAKFEDGVRKSSENVEGDGGLMFKKKMKFKTPTAEVNRNPKGFGGVKEDGGLGEVDEMGRNASVGTDGMELLEVDDKESTRETLEKGTGRLDEGQDREAGNVELRNGTVDRTIQGRSASEDVKSTKPRGFGKKNPESLKKETRGTTVKSKKQALANKVSGEQSDDETDPWWLRLPYVLVIFMRRGSDGQGGLFSIDFNSQSQNENDASYTVAFEDRGDANNFSFVLESCFEDQDDFTANAAPLPIKELHEAVKSDDMKVIVVKKGQIQLYAGQPFAEVEMALRSLVLRN